MLILQFWNFQKKVVLFRNKQRHGIIRPQNDKLNHYTGTGCEIYLQLMVKITQTLHCHCSSVLLDAFNKIPYLVLFLVLLPLNSELGKLGNDDENLAMIMNHPFPQFLDIFHLKKVYDIFQ